MKRLAIALAFVPLIVIVLIFLSNLGDEPLDASLERMLATETREPSDSARRAHLYLLGLAAGERVAPERRGRELLPQTADRSVREALDAKGWTNTTFESCANDVCGAADLTLENEAILESSKTLVGLYAGLMEFEDYAFEEPFLMIPDVRTHRLFTLALAQWLALGGEARVWHALESSNRFYSRALVQGPLLARMMALHDLVIDVRFVAQARRDHRELAVPTDVFESIAIPDATTILGGAIEAEMKALSPMIEDLRHGPGRIGLRPRETMNRLFDLYNQILFTDCPVIDRACVPALGYLGFRKFSHWFVNPTGRYFATEISESLHQRRIVEAKLSELAAAKHSAQTNP